MQIADARPAQHGKAIRLTALGYFTLVPGTVLLTKIKKHQNKSQYNELYLMH